MIDLYQHNKGVYDAAISMLESTGKADIIHPTGTGKSFIGFKLCENHPEVNVCWLSPSEYISGTYVCADGYPLGQWIANRRSNKKSTGKYRIFSKPKTLYISPDGYRLGEWLRSQKSRYRLGTLPKEKVQKLATVLQGE